MAYSILSSSSLWFDGTFGRHLAWVRWNLPFLLAVVMWTPTIPAGKSHEWPLIGAAGGCLIAKRPHRVGFSGRQRFSSHVFAHVLP